LRPHFGVGEHHPFLICSTRSSATSRQRPITRSSRTWQRRSLGWSTRFSFPVRC